MKKDKNKTIKGENVRDEISRKEALQKAGKYAVVTAASMLVILSPKEAQAQSPESPPTPGDGW